MAPPGTWKIPLASFAFTGWWAGQAPESAGVDHGDVASAAGWGGNGNGWGSQPARVDRLGAAKRLPDRVARAGEDPEPEESSQRLAHRADSRAPRRVASAMVFDTGAAIWHIVGS